MKTLYPVYCVWCQEEGVLNQISESTIENSSGVCRYHLLVGYAKSGVMRPSEKEELERLKKGRK